MSAGKMRGHVGVGGHCPVEGHGEGCELNRDLREQRMDRAQEKESWLREKWEAILADAHPDGRDG